MDAFAEKLDARLREWKPETAHRAPEGIKAVSYTHLDVYKRQVPNTQSHKGDVTPKQTWSLAKWW